MYAYDLMLHFMSDDLTLHSYLRGESVKENKLVDNLTVCLHQNRREIPDHYYQGWKTVGFQNYEINNPVTLEQIFIKWLPNIANNLFQLNQDNVICVKDGMWNDWLGISKEFSPLVLKALFIWYTTTHDDNLDASDLIDVNYKYTALPQPLDSTILTLRKQLSDDHIHAGSSLESDIAWLHLLHDPKFFIEDNDNKQNEFSVNEIVDTRKELYDYTRYAILLIRYLKEGSNRHFQTPEDFLNEIILSKNNTNTSIINGWLKMDFPLQAEASMIIKILREIDQEDIYAAVALHFYLLLKGHLRKYLVMQSTQYGLMQFNRNLHLPFRGKMMDYLADSLKQMTGNDLQGAGKIELRINIGNLKQLDAIKSAIKKLQDSQPANNKTEVTLLCHFIKDSEKKYLEKNCRVLCSYLPNIVGIDFAGNDFTSGPKKFIDCVNSIRRENRKIRFTYHAGEDFYHILDGLRTIYEVVEFLDYGEGDRIGHASAAGVSPRLWAENIGGTLPISQGRYLYDLLFALNLIKDKNMTKLSLRRVHLEKRIKELSAEVYGKEMTLSELTNIWQDKSVDESQQEINNKFNKVIVVDCFEILSAEDLTLLQQEIMKILHDKKIVVEACPTSNVSIGHCHSFDDYHLKTWLRWKSEGKAIPRIVLGSDETGVFSTNIANEYASVYDMLKRDSFPNANNIITDIAKDSVKFSFT